MVAQVLMNGKQTRDHARRCARPSADMKLLGGGAKIGRNRSKIQLAGGAFSFGGLGKKIIEDRFVTIRHIGHHEATTAKGGQHDFGNARGDHASHGGVKGIAPGAQHAGSGVCRYLMSRCHNTPHQLLSSYRVPNRLIDNAVFIFRRIDP